MEAESCRSRMDATRINRIIIAQHPLALAIIDVFEHTYPCKELDKSLDTSTEDDGY